MSGKYLKARQLAKEMEKKAKKTAEKKKEAKSKKEKAEESLEIVNSLDIDVDLDDLEEKLEKGQDELDKKNFENSFDTFREIIEEIKSRSVAKHDDIIDPIERLLEEASDDIDLGSLKEEIDESRNLIQEGKLKEAFDKAFEIEDKSDDIINKKLKEELKKLNSIFEMINDSKDVKEKIGEFISKAEYSLEADDYSRTLSLIRNTKEAFGDDVKNILYEKIDILREREIELEEQGIKVPNSEKWLKSARKKIDEGQYIDAFNSIEKSKSKIYPLYGEEILRDKFNELTHEINEGEDIGAETEAVKKIREEAEKLQEENDIEKAESRLKDAFEEVEEAKFDKVLNTIAESREDFIKAKEMGANIEKPMELLKSARNSLKNDNYKEALDWARKGREEVQNLTKKLEKAKKDLNEKRKEVNELKKILEGDFSNLRELIDESEKKLEEKKAEEAISILAKVDEKIEKEVRDDILNLIDDFDRLNQAAEKLSIDIDEFSKQKEDSKRKVESSEFVESGRIVQRGKENIKQSIEDKLDEKKQEIQQSLKEFRKIDDEVKTKIDELIEKGEEKINEGDYILGVDKLKEAEKIFEKAKIETTENLIEKTSQFLSQIEEIAEESIELEPYKENIGRAESSLNKEMYSEALDFLIDFLSEFSKEVHTLSKKEVEKAEKTGVGVKNLKKELQNSADMMNEGDNIESIESSIGVMSEAKDNRKMRKEAYEKIYDGSSKISELKKKNKLENGDSIRKLLEGAKENFKKENYSEAIQKADDALDSLKNLETKSRFLDKRKQLEDRFRKAKKMEEFIGKIKNFDPELEKIDRMSDEIGIAGAQDKLDEKHKELEELLSEVVKEKREEIEDFIEDSGIMGFNIEDYKDQLDRTKSLVNQEKSLDALIYLEQIEEELKNIKGAGKIAREKIEDLMALLRKAEIMGVNTSGLEKLLEEAQKKLEEDKFEESLKKAKQAESKIKNAQKKRVESILENFNQKIKKLKNRDVDTTLAENKIQKAKDAKNEGNYIEAIRFAMQSEGELEKINNQKIIAGNIISRTKKLLEEVQDKGVFIDEAKEIFQKSEQTYENGFYPKSVKNSLKTAEELSNIFQTYNRLKSFLKSIDGIIDEFEEDDKVNISELLEEKEEIEENYKNGKYQQAIVHMKNIEEILSENEDYLKDIISNVVKRVEEKGIKNVDEAIEKLEKAKFLINWKNTVKALKNIDEAKELSGLKKLKRYDTLMKQVQYSIKNAKKFGASVENIEKRVQEAKNKKKSEDLDEAYDKIEHAHKMIEEVLENYSPKPHVKVSDTLTMNEWNPTNIYLKNKGEALGKNLQIELRGGELKNFSQGGKLKAGEEIDIEVEIYPEKENAMILAKVFRIFDDEVFEDEHELKISKGSKIKKIGEEKTCDYCGDKIKEGEKMIHCSCGKVYELSCGEDIKKCKNCETRLKTEKEEREKKKRKRVPLDI